MKYKSNIILSFCRYHFYHFKYIFFVFFFGSIIFTLYSLFDSKINFHGIILFFIIFIIYWIFFIFINIIYFIFRFKTQWIILSDKITLKKSNLKPITYNLNETFANYYICKGFIDGYSLRNMNQSTIIWKYEFSKKDWFKIEEFINLNFKLGKTINDRIGLKGLSH